jgi:predicted esterase
MTDIKEFIEKSGYEFSDDKYKIYKFEEPTLNKKYGSIKLLSIKLNKSDGYPIIVIPGYSHKSFYTMLKIILEGLDNIKDKYSELFIFQWSPEIKETSEKIIENVIDTNIKYEINEKFRIELSEVLDKLLRSPDIKLDKFDLMGKSAGGGVAAYVGKINNNVNKLILISPGSISHGENLKDFKNKIILSWNEDDPVILKDEIDQYIENFKKNNNKYKYYSFEKGGHEINIELLDKL